MPLLSENFEIIEGDIEVGVERLLGTIKIDGVVYDRYIKVVDCGTTSANTEKRVDDTINCIGVLSSYASVKTPSGSLYNVNYVNANGPFAYYNNNKIYLNTPTAADQCLFVIQYYR